VQFLFLCFLTRAFPVSRGNTHFFSQDSKLTSFSQVPVPWPTRRHSILFFPFFCFFLSQRFWAPKCSEAFDFFLFQSLAGWPAELSYPLLSWRPLPPLFPPAPSKPGTIDVIPAPASVPKNAVRLTKATSFFPLVQLLDSALILSGSAAYGTGSLRFESLA